MYSDSIKTLSKVYCLALGDPASLTHRVYVVWLVNAAVESCVSVAEIHLGRDCRMNSHWCHLPCDGRMSDEGDNSHQTRL